MSKIALCLTGKVGNLNSHTGLKKSDIRLLMKGYEHYKRHILDKNDVDVFLHCWDTEFDFDLRMLYKPKKCLIEKQKYFKIPSYVRGKEKFWQIKAGRIRNQSTYSKWYSNMMVNKLKSEYEKENNFKYEFVMTSRFDIAFEKDVIFEKFDNSKFYAGNWSLVFDKDGNNIFKAGKGEIYELVERNDPIIDELIFKKEGYPQNDNGLLDFWFFTNSNYSDQFFSLFNFLDEYNKPNMCPLSRDKAALVSNHQLCLYHLEQLNLKDKLEFAFDFYDDFPLIRRKYYKDKD